MLDMTVESLDSIGEQHRGLYAEGEDGKFHLQINTPAETNPPASTTPPKVVEVIPESVKTQLAEYEEWKKQQQAAEDDKLKKQGDFEALTARMTEKHQQELATKDDAYNGVVQKFHTHLIKSTVMEAITKHGGDAELLMPHIMPNLKVGDNDSIQVVDSNGEARLTAQAGKSDLMTVDEYVLGLKNHEKLGKLFAGSSASGGGSKTQQNAQIGAVTNKSQLKDVSQKVAYIDKYGLEAFNKLPA